MVSTRRRSTPATSPPSRSRDKARRPARKAHQTVVVGINFGSSAISAAFTVDNGPLEQVSMGMVHGRGGKLEHVYKLPTWVRFTGHNQFETLQHLPVTDYENTSSGAKQSLDHRLCTPSSEGAFFLDLCNRYSVSNTDVITKLLKDALPYINKAIQKKLGKESDWSLNVPIPTTWARGGEGNKIQADFYSCLLDAGYPLRIRFDIEAGVTQTYRLYLLYEQLKALKKRATVFKDRVLYIDIGASTADFVIRVGRDQCTLLAEEPKGCGGGMANFWRVLFRHCCEIDRSLTFFEAVRDYVHTLGGDAAKEDEDFIRDGHVIRAAEIKRMIRECFAEPLETLKRMITETPQITDIVVSGEAPTSNDYIKELWRNAINEAFTEADRKGCPVTFVEPDVASMAVCMGAAIPYEEDPRPRFQRSAFGFRLGEESRTDDRVEQVKARSSITMKGWNLLHTDDLRDGKLTIEPLMMVGGKPLKRKLPKETKPKGWSPSNAAPMNDFVVDLHDYAELNSTLWVKFEVDPEKIDPTRNGNPDDAPQIKFIVALPHGEEKKNIREIVLSLYADRDRLFLVEEDGGSNSKQHKDQSRLLIAPLRNALEVDCQEEEIWETPPPTRESIETPATTPERQHSERDDQPDEAPAPKRQRRDGSPELGRQSAEASIARLSVDNEEIASPYPAQIETASGGELSNSECAEEGVGPGRASPSARFYGNASG